MSSTFANGLFWLSVACCALAQFFILRSVGASRHSSGATPGLPRHRGVLEIVWAVLPAVGLAVLLLFTWRAVRVTSTSRPPMTVWRVGSAR
jgi:heme/copper-type cytochrome/quinol oxidase subunit 2